ncbi:MAG TPA: FAD-dependent oxidoreductase [Thermoflexia bacterium]|nr:FAD-dependent oxidoreductase [Thermoflexia bacterium]
MEIGLLPQTSEPYDVIIIGGGPAGATAALYTARAGFRTLVVDKGLTAGALGMASKIVNYPGIQEPISGSDLVRRIRDQAASFGAEFVTDKVLRVSLRDEPKQVWGGRGVYRGRVVVIATGAMGRTRRIPGEERLLGRGVSYCATCDGPFFSGKEVAVVGNNDEAVEEALTLTRFATRVHLLSPTAELQSSPELTEEVTAHPQVSLHLATRVREILGEERVEGVRIASRGEERILPVAGVFVYLQGNVPVTDFLGDQLPVEEGGCLVVDENFQTPIPGVFAIGDVLCRHLKQAVVAAADGVRAAMAIDRYLSGRGKLRPDWS